ncbi:hypothetical protein [Actinacidiphila acididurans]|uniref:Uncharacterized protein n=1 Tax=Actinacidiphila acididurans TaxID=2784346 RepID=A0ABS2TK04_9ACTN|nr:hypothetical protein [Actinacidiphila acididurans]MBM9503152.1 hypothetical protein [Actinacidiphila acididurans]
MALVIAYRRRRSDEDDARRDATRLASECWRSNDAAVHPVPRQLRQTPRRCPRHTQGAHPERPGVLEKEQRFPHGLLDNLVENPVDLTAMSVRPHAATEIVLNDLDLGLVLAEDEPRR